MRFPRPRLKELHACDRGITATNLVPGARVIAVRSGGPAAFGCATAGTLNMSAAPELQEGETVTAHQEFPECSIASGTTELTVGPATPVPVPSVFPSICAGTTRVLIRNLRVGALVQIFVDGVLLGEREASSAAQVFQLPSALAAGSLLTAAQTVCGNLSEESEAVVVASAPAAVNTPSISGPLHACAPAVMVQGLTLGAQIMIRDQTTGAPRSDSEFVFDSVAVLPVSPALMPGETLVASIRSCGVQAESAPMTVESVMVPFRPPRIQSPVFEDAFLIEILDAIPGATVEISLDDVWTYSFVALRTAMDIFVGDLPLGTAIRTRQRLCSTVSVRSSRVVVRAAGPRIVTESPLPDGEVGVPYNAAIVAVGGVAPLEWSKTSGLVPLGLALSSTTGVLAGTPELAEHDVITVEVQDTGSPGAPSVSDERSFRIHIADGSATPVSGASRVDIWNCHTEHRTVRIWTNDLTAGTGWQEKQSLAPQHDSSGMCPADAPPFQIHLEDGHVYLIGAVDPDSDDCPNHQNDPNQGQCLRYSSSFEGNDNAGVRQIEIT